VRIFATTPQDFERMMQAGLLIDHAIRKPGQFLDAWLSASEFQMLKNSGVPYEVLHDDWVEYYNSRDNFMTPEEFDQAMRHSEEVFSVSHSVFGTMRGIYPKYTKDIAKLDSLTNTDISFPEILTRLKLQPNNMKQMG
jgi:hypothetical protein